MYYVLESNWTSCNSRMGVTMRGLSSQPPDAAEIFTVFFPKNAHF